MVLYKILSYMESYHKEFLLYDVNAMTNLAGNEMKPQKHDGKPAGWMDKAILCPLQLHLWTQ